MASSTDARLRLIGCAAYDIMRIKRAAEPVKAITGLAAAVLRYVLPLRVPELDVSKTFAHSSMKLYDRHKGLLLKAVSAS